MIPDHIKIQLLNIATSVPADVLDEVIDNYLKLERLIDGAPEEKIADNQCPTMLPDYVPDYTTTSTSNHCCSSAVVYTKPSTPCLSGTWSCLDGYYPSPFWAPEKFNTEKEPESKEVSEETAKQPCKESEQRSYEESKQPCECKTTRPLTVLEKIRDYVDNKIRTSDPLVKLYAEESAIRDNVNSLLGKKIQAALLEIDKELGLKAGDICEQVYDILDAYAQKLKGEIVQDYDCTDPSDDKFYKFFTLDTLHKLKEMGKSSKENEENEEESDLPKSKTFVSDRPIRLPRSSYEFLGDLTDKEKKFDSVILDETDLKEVEKFKAMIEHFTKRYNKKY